MRETAFEYLAILIATDLRKTGTSISKDASVDVSCIILKKIKFTL